MSIKKGDLVRRIRGFDPNLHPWFLKPALVISTPYEDPIKLTDLPVPVIDICIVVDLMIDTNIHKKIPISELTRIASSV